MTACRPPQADRKGWGTQVSSITNFLQNFDAGQLLYLLISAAAALMCITIHEVSHGFAAYRLGDPTAKSMGRLSLNPVKHIDPLGLLMMIVARVGWAKPVPVDMRYFKHPRRDMALTALAGPLSNFVTALIAVALASLCWHVLPVGTAVSYLILLLCYVAVLSVGLGLFNLIPIPPLDGSKVLFALLPDRIYGQILRYERYFFLVVIVLTFLGLFSGPLSAAMGAVLRAFCWVTGFPFVIFQYYFF